MTGSFPAMSPIGAAGYPFPPPPVTGACTPRGDMMQNELQEIIEREEV